MQTILVGRKIRRSTDGGRKVELEKLLQRMNRGRDTAATNIAAWTLDALILTENIASDFAQDVAQWSVLYAKEVPEP